MNAFGALANEPISIINVSCSNNGLAPTRRQAIIWTNVGHLLTHICVPRPQWLYRSQFTADRCSENCVYCQTAFPITVSVTFDILSEISQDDYRWSVPHVVRVPLLHLDLTSRCSVKHIQTEAIPTYFVYVFKRAHVCVSMTRDTNEAIVDIEIVSPSP